MTVISRLCWPALMLALVLAGPVRGATGDEDPGERVIVMSTGRVLQGFASRNAGGWLVEQSNGRVQVPIEQVSVVARSLVDAYRKQRDSVAKPTPATHLALAQWCISYRLHDEARDELRECLKLDPDHTAARRLLRRIDETLEARPAPETPRPPTRDGFLVPDAESLGGLSAETATTFTQRIQPLLINKCGNASCHGITTTSTQHSEGFRLLSVRSGSNGHRLYTERNLAEVLRYVDLTEPSLSPLLTIPQDAHAGLSNVFGGASGEMQARTLRTWIKRVVEERRRDEEQIAARPRLDSTRTAAMSPATTVTPAVAVDTPSEPVPRAQTTTGGGLSQRRPTAGIAPGPVPFDPAAKPAILPETEPAPSADPFDPDVFNRKSQVSAPR